MKFEITEQIFCLKRNKQLNKSWWQDNVHKLALIALETQTSNPSCETNSKANKSSRQNAPNTQIIQLSFSVSLVGLDYIQELNSNFRDIDKSTDVLSFPTYENFKSLLWGPEKDKQTKQIFLQPEIEIGDIFICLPVLIKQAQEYGHTLEREAAFLFVHGLLHLLGYDHVNFMQQKEMFALQDKILLAAGFSR